MKRLLLALLLLLMGGCAAVPVEAPEPEQVSDFQAHVARVIELDRWSLAGRAAISTPTDAGNLTVQWRELGPGYQVDLRAPLGAGTVRLIGNGDSVLLRTSAGEEATAADAGELLQRYTGYDLPVEALRYWLLGIPVPEVPADRTFGESGLLDRLEQLGWQIDYRRYGDFGGIALPTKVFLRNGEGIELRLVVQDWELEA